MYLSLDRNLVDGDEVVRSSSFLTCRNGGRGCHSAVLCGDHHCDVVWWSRWSELGGAARDVVWWSSWSELGGARSAARRGLLDGSLRLANGSDSLFDGLESHLGDDVAVGDLVVMR